MSTQQPMTHEQMRDEILSGELAAIQEMVRRALADEEATQ